NINELKEKKITWREKKEGLDEIYTQVKEIMKECPNDYVKATTKLKKWYRSLPDGHPSKQHEHYNHIDERGVYFPDNISWPGGGGPVYEVIHPKTQRPVKIPSRGWLFTK